MGPIRILVVDDSVVTRRVLSATLSGDSALEVVGTASDGHIALAKIPLLKPDLITLDIEMPVMNGLETLAAIRKLYPQLRVIMFSAFTEHGAAATLDALALGASDYAAKPGNTNPADAVDYIRLELIPKIKALCGIAPQDVPPLPPPRSAWKTRDRATGRIDVVAIGASTGGPSALSEVLPRIPNDFPVPIVVVQHMPPIFTRQLAERLSACSAIRVEEGNTDAILSPGHAWIAPGDFHMTVIRRGLNWRLNLDRGPRVNSCRPAVDVLFRSVALAYGANALGVVMTGMGTDGALGAQEIRDAGGDVIIQDQASAVVWGMPGAVYTLGISDGAYPLDRLAAEITRRVRRSRGPVVPVEVGRCSSLGLPAK